MFNNKQSGQFFSCIYVKINNNKHKKYGLLSVSKSYEPFQDSMDPKDQDDWT